MLISQLKAFSMQADAHISSRPVVITEECLRFRCYFFILLLQDIHTCCNFWWWWVLTLLRFTFDEYERSLQAGRSLTGFNSFNQVKHLRSCTLEISTSSFCRRKRNAHWKIGRLIYFNKKVMRKSILFCFLLFWFVVSASDVFFVGLCLSKFAK